MKITYLDNKYIIFLKTIVGNDITELCEDIINLLNDKFNLELKGFIEIDAYIDKRYGVVLEISNDYDDIYSNFKRLDININMNNTKFIYRIIDIFSFNLNKFYLYKNECFIDIEAINDGNIEFCELIYKDVDNIKKNGKLVVL